MKALPPKTLCSNTFTLVISHVHDARVHECLILTTIRTKLLLYLVKVTVYIKKSNDPQTFIRLLNKLCSQVLYQCFIQGLYFS